MRTFLAGALLLVGLFELGNCQSGAPPMSFKNSLQICTAETPGSEWVRRGIHLRKRNECLQGYICDGNNILPLIAECRPPSYLSVHTGTCSFPNVYTYIFGSFNCSAEEADRNLNYDELIARRDALCAPLIAQAGPATTELYVGDPDDCRQMYKCPNVATHDDWLHRCLPGMRFQAGEEGPCVLDDTNCAGNPGRK